jgi:pSer/pThr/pTyr-binding forkhead associated (FHA) protein
VQPAPPPPKAAPSGRTPLATLEIVNEGPLKGTKFEIHSALTNVGRGAHNDVVLNDESVSDSHAKIQKRDGGWYIVDQESTNGTYVGGRRVQGEQRVEGAPDVRFGGIKMTFRPVAVAGDESGSTRAIAAVTVDQTRQPVAPAKPTPVPAETKKKGCGAMIAFLMAAAAAGTTLLMILLSTGR